MTQDTAIVEAKTDNTKFFRKIVRDYNKKTGFSFELPKDTDYSSKYAHPVHDDGTLVLRGQIDDDRENAPTREIYGITGSIDGVSMYINIENYEELKRLIATEQCKYRLTAIKQLQNLADELVNRIQESKDVLFDKTISDLEKEDNYDLAIKTAKTLYKS